MLGTDGRRAVYFFGTTLNSRLVAVQGGLGNCLAPRRDDPDGELGRGRPLHGLRATRCTGRWGAADVQLAGTGRPMRRLDGFADTDRSQPPSSPTRWMATSPARMVASAATAVWHERLRPRTRPRASRADYAVFRDAGLVEPGARPRTRSCSSDQCDFDVLLPPTRVVHSPTGHSVTTARTLDITRSNGCTPSIGSSGLRRCTDGPGCRAGWPSESSRRVARTRRADSGHRGRTRSRETSGTTPRRHVLARSESTSRPFRSHPDASIAWMIRRRRRSPRSATK